MANIDNESDIFKDCKSLKKIEIDNFKINNVDDINAMFSGCSNELIDEIKNHCKI